MIKTLLLSVTVLAVALGGCGDKDKDEGKGGEAPKTGEGAPAAGGNLDEGQKFSLERGQDNLAEIKTALEAGEATDTKCAATLAYAKQLDGVEDDGARAFVAEVTRVCELDAPLATAEREIVKAEEARTAEPDKNPLSECFNAKISMAFKTLDAKHGDNEQVVALKERFKVVCPDQAE